MVCHILSILTLEEFVELALDGITIPHGQWTLIFVLSYGLMEAFSEPQCELLAHYILKNRALLLLRYYIHKVFYKNILWKEMHIIFGSVFKSFMNNKWTHIAQG